jgi:hypothetical protein
MNQAEPEFCFCTIAFGKKYRALALLLAQDIERYSPKTYFIVLTDNPSDFSKQRNILAFKHRSQSVKFYHDKRFAIAKALSLYNSCIFIDADMRIVAPVPADMQWIKKVGITARTCEIMPKKYAKVLAGTACAKLCREFKVTKKAAQKLNIDRENEKVKFVYEYLFAVTKDCGKELEFFKQWETLANYFELNGIYDGEGNAIGLAAAKAGLDVRLSEMEGISFFKDKTELVRIQKGQSKMEEMSIYFEQQKMLEYPKRSIKQKVAAKLGQSITHLYNLVRLRIVTLSKFNLYYR